VVGTRPPAAARVVRSRYVTACTACIASLRVCPSLVHIIGVMPLGQRGRVLAWLLLLLTSPSAAALADDTLIGWQGERYREPGADLRRVRLFPDAQPVRRFARACLHTPAAHRPRPRRGRAG